jgi:hypothetical protein
LTTWPSSKDRGRPTRAICQILEVLDEATKNS